MEFPEARLLIFAKAPMPGRVKTRLAQRFGVVRAAHLYQSLLRWTVNQAVQAELCPVELWCSPDTRHGFFQACRRDYGLTLQTQRGADLGQRIHHALQSTLHNSTFAVLIGSDCASLGVGELRFALTALQAGREAVLGPAEDGGYVLIGLRQAQPKLFRNIAWGTPRVLPATRQRLRQAGLDWTELPLGWDVDHPKDIRRWRLAKT